jgi:hypothetical protein
MKGEALRTTIHQLFQVILTRSSHVELVFICPEPSCGDTTGNRSVSLTNGLTSCWRCNKGGKFVPWARRLGYPVVDSAKAMARPIEEIDLSMYVPPRNPTPPVRAVDLPHGFTACAKAPRSVYTELIGEMAVAKNLFPQDVIDAGVGFTKKDNEWEKYAIFPVTEYGETVYYQGRTYIDEPDKQTKKFPSAQVLKYGSKYWVYGIDEVKSQRPETVIVVESILNVLSLRWLLKEKGITAVVPVAVFKHTMSHPQVAKILRHDCVKEICLLYDHDASKRAWDRAPLISDQVNLTIANMPLGSGGKKTDPNDDVHAAFKAFRNRVTYSQVRSNAFMYDAEFFRRDRYSTVIPTELPVGYHALDSVAASLEEFQSKRPEPVDFMGDEEEFVDEN